MKPSAFFMTIATVIIFTAAPSQAFRHDHYHKDNGLLDALQKRQQSNQENLRAIGEMFDRQTMKNIIEARQKRWRNIANEFIAQRDFTLDGVIDFVSSRDLSPAEINGIIDIAKTMNGLER